MSICSTILHQIPNNPNNYAKLKVPKVFHLSVDELITFFNNLKEPLSLDKINELIQYLRTFKQFTFREAEGTEDSWEYELDIHDGLQNKLNLTVYGKSRIYLDFRYNNFYYSQYQIDDYIFQKYTNQFEAAMVFFDYIYQMSTKEYFLKCAAVITNCYCPKIVPILAHILELNTEQIDLLNYLLTPDMNFYKVTIAEDYFEVEIDTITADEMNADFDSLYGYQFVLHLKRKNNYFS